MIIKKIVLSILLIASFVLIGTPLKYNTTILNLIIIGLGIIYYGYKALYKKEIIITDKIDVLVFVFYIMPLLPIICGKCDSISETLIALARNMSLFNIYIFIKELVGKDKKTIELISSIFIFSSLGLVFLGIDEEISRVVYKYFMNLGIPESYEFPNRFVSTIGYPNAFAVLTSVALCLSIYKVKNAKILYSSMIFVFIFALLLTYSRAVFLMFAVLMIIYLILNKRKRKYIIYNIIQNLVLALIGMKIYEKAYASKQYVFLLLGMLICFGISVLIAKLIAKKYKRICKIKKKNYIVLSVVIILFLFVAIIVGLKLEKPLDLFKKNESNVPVNYYINNISGNTEYCFEFEIDAKVQKNPKSPIYSIEIYELNKYDDTLSEKKIIFGEFNGKKEINLKTSKDAVSINLKINSNLKEVQNGLKIKSFKINNEKYILDYLYLPVNLVERLKSFNFKDKSVWERLTFYKDGISIAKDDLLTGKGARAWVYNYESYQSYVYTTTEVHSYPIELLIEYGIFSVILLVYLIGYALIKILKRKHITEIDMALLLMILHSIMDFDLSYFVMLLLFISLFTIVIKQNTTDEKEIENLKLRKMLTNIFIGTNIVILILGTSGYCIKKKEEKLIKEISSYTINLDSSKILDKVLEIKETKKYKRMLYAVLLTMDYKDVDNEKLKIIYEFLEEQGISANAENNIKRNNIIRNIVEDVNDAEIKEKFKEIIIKENNEMIESIKNQEVNRLTEKQINSYLKQQERIYNFIRKR